MTHPANFETKTGFDQIRALLKEQCLFGLGSQKVDAIRFSFDFERIREQLDQVAEFRNILYFEAAFPADNYYDPTPALRNAKVEGTYIVVEDLILLRRSLEAIKAVLRFFNNAAPEKYPCLRKLSRDVASHPFVVERIDAILSGEGRIRDHASVELKQIRVEKAHKQALAGKRLQSLLKSAIADGYVETDAAISIRDGRQVIPVPSSNKRKISGIIHDESATGRTAYIEPAELVELNNELRELEIAEQREIIRILVAFTVSIRPYIDELLSSHDFLGTIDFIRAKALFAIRISAGRPALVHEQGFRWKQAVHPLLLLHHRLENKEVVPLDIELDQEHRILIISGPNAGGKSVCLKTVALLQYMLQCGLLIPMAESSEAGMFRDILIDIGDEQSIENDLSTYSSHLLNMKFFLRQASPESLILIDEFGAGTEPVIGGAIAEAILESLNQKGSFGVITTHYSNLKHVAASTKGIINGAMLFDSAKMQPLFRLETGKPGSSFAIDIARQIGLPEEILQSASSRAGEDHVKFDRHLREILRDKRYWEDKRDRIRVAEKQLEVILERYENELLEIKKLRKEVTNKARSEADDLLSRSNREIEKTIRLIREGQAEKETTSKARMQLKAFRDKLLIETAEGQPVIDNKLDTLEADRKKFNIRGPVAEPVIEKEKEKEEGIGTGDIVRLTGNDTVGEVIDRNGDNLVIALGESMFTTVKRSLVEKAGADLKKKWKAEVAPSRPSWDISQRKLNFRSEIDVRGKRAGEALEIVKYFIDDATMVGISELRILHGKGNGILKQLIREYLCTLDIVISCGDERVEHGGSGITVVKLNF